MKPSQLLCAKSSEEGVIIVEGLYNNKLRIMGSSVAKFIANEEFSNSVTLSIKKGDRGFIAITVLTHNGKNMEAFDFFLKIGRGEDGERPLIDLDSQWGFKSPERLGVIYFSGIRTEIDGVIFSSNKYDKKPGMRYVSDHNILCKYLVGDIEADIVEKAAAERIDEENARIKLPELEKEVQKLATLLAEKENLLAKKEEELSMEKKEVEESFKQEMMIYKRLSAASKVIEEVEKQWFHRPSLMEAIQIYKAVMTR